MVVWETSLYTELASNWINWSVVVSTCTENRLYVIHGRNTWLVITRRWPTWLPPARLVGMSGMTIGTSWRGRLEAGVLSLASQVEREAATWPVANSIGVT